MPRKLRLMRMVELVHLDASGSIISERRDLLNVVHVSGEEFMLGALFAGVSVPNFYYIGLDSRESPSALDEMSDLEGLEPETGGYERKPVNSGEFNLELGSSGSLQATGPTVLFRAEGGSWGPVRNVFLCTGLGYGDAVLVSSVPIGQELTVQEGETVSMRMAMSLSGC